MTEIKNIIKPKAESTLYSMKKSELIEYIRCLENNYNTAVWFNENQARYIESLGLRRMDGSDCNEPRDKRSIK